MPDQIARFNLPPEGRKCNECLRLWNEYVSTLLEHARLERQVYMVSAGQEAGQIEALKVALEAAKIAKDIVYRMIYGHERTHLKTAPGGAATLQ